MCVCVCVSHFVNLLITVFEDTHLTIVEEKNLTKYAMIPPYYITFSSMIFKICHPDFLPLAFTQCLFRQYCVFIMFQTSPKTGDSEKINSLSLT